MVETVTECNEPQKVDIVAIDGNEDTRDRMVDLLKEREKVAHAYSCPEHFLKNLSEYSKDTIISTGYIFGDFRDRNRGLDGLDLLNRIYKEGYAKLYLLTWSDFSYRSLPYYVKYLEKSGNCEHDVDRLLEE